jgi:hypothetical protein
VRTVDALRSSIGKTLFGNKLALEQCMSVPSFDMFLSGAIFQFSGRYKTEMTGHVKFKVKLK